MRWRNCNHVGSLSRRPYTGWLKSTPSWLTIPQTTACAAGEVRRAQGKREYDDEYVGGEYGKNDKSANSGTDEGALSC